jgi:tetratricopeptide (TPR) repeat protein
MPRRQPLAREGGDAKLFVRLFDRPQQRYEVAWAAIESVKLFDELVLEEAAGLAKEKKFDEAYEYYLFMEQRDPRFPGVAEGMQNCLFQEALHWKQQGRFDQALALLNELHGRNANFANLEPALAEVVDRLVAGHFEAGRYAAARKLLEQFKSKFPNNAQAQARQQQIVAVAQKALTEAQQAFAAGDLRSAHRAASQATTWWPDLPGAAELAKEIHGRYPILAVGVSSRGGWSAAGLETFAARRTARLVGRQLFELADFGEDGGKFICPFGQAKIEGPLVALALEEGRTWPKSAAGRAGLAITSFDLAQSLRWRVEHAVPEGTLFSGPAFGGLGRHGDELLAARLDRVELTSPRQAHIHLRGKHPRVEALLQIPLAPWPAAGSSAAERSSGPYRVDAASEGEVRYIANTDYFAYTPGQALELVERRVGSFGAAVPLLRSGAIVAFDRPAPWDVPKASRYHELAVEAYAAPSVHVLVPNPRHALLSRSDFRRALVHGLNRQRILDEALLAQPDSKRGQVISGPFPNCYAYDKTVAPHDYDPRLMVALIQTALSQPRGAARLPTEAKPRLTLALPSGEVARRACAEIKAQWHLLGHGLDVELLELGDSPPASSAWDLLYVEYFPTDPAVDALRLLGREGLAGGGSPLLEAQLRRLSSASDLAEARGALTAIHRTVHDQLDVIPLWQLNEHFVRVRTLQGAGSRPATLYQNVEQWRQVQENKP